jgi:DNA-binding response OmpR family regulator
MSRSESRPVVLLAEEDAVLRNRVARALRVSGCGVLEARNSVEALVLAASYGGHIEALVTSMELRSYSNGPELAHCLRVSRPEMRVICLSDSHYPDELISRDEELGGATVLHPPLTSAELMALVAEVLTPSAAKPAKSPV